MPIRTSQATWKGNLRDGSGDMTIGDGLYRGAYSFASRFQEGEGTNPEELLAAAQAGCFSMALSNDLATEGFEPDRVHTTAAVHLEDGEITLLELDVEADVPGIDEETFMEAAEEAKVSCPVSRALSDGPEITLNATLT